MYREQAQKFRQPNKHGALTAMLVLPLLGLSIFTFFKTPFPAKIYTFFSPSAIFYSSASDPITIQIPFLGIDAPVVPLGLNKDGSIQVPAQDNEVGWYEYGTVPGQTGAAVLVGHLDSAYGKAIFYNLRLLQPGQEIKITLKSGSVAVFKVDSLEQASQNSFPTEQVYGKINYPGLRLITCSGTYDKQAKHYTNNLIVYGSLIKPVS